MRLRRLFIWLVLWVGLAVAGAASIGCPLIGTNSACPEPGDLKFVGLGLLIGPYATARFIFEWMSLASGLSHLLAAIFLGLFYAGLLSSFRLVSK